MEETKKRGRPRKQPGEPKTHYDISRPDASERLKKLQNPGEPGDNAKYLTHALATMSQPKIDISDPKQVEDRLWWYFGHCAENDMKPTVSGMCNSLGIHRDTLRVWKNGEYRADTHQAIILNAYTVLEELWENYMMNGKINPVSGIFLGKNLFNYSDQSEVVLSANTGNIAEATPETIEAKYAELPED